MNGRAYPDRPIPAVLAYVERDASVLLVRRGKAPNLGLWGLPGGGQELGEGFIEAARRELLEETGLLGRQGEPVDVFDSITRDALGRIEHHYLLVVVKFAQWSGNPVAASDAIALGWFAETDLDHAQILSTVRPVVNRVRRRIDFGSAVNPL